MRIFHDMRESRSEDSKKTQPITYEVTNHLPQILKLKSPLTPRMLMLYGMYRNGLYNTRIGKNLDKDVSEFEPRFNDCPPRSNPHLYHYSSYVSLDAMHELKEENGQCCVAYQALGQKKIAVGFLVFYEKQIEGEKMVYISHVSVKQLHQGIGTRLIQSVLMNYPANTLFYLCSRKSNTDALSAYRKLGFKIAPDFISHFGYKPEYFVGMACTTTPEMLNEIQLSLIENPHPNQTSYFQP